MGNKEAKKWYKKPWFIVVVIILLLIVLKSAFNTIRDAVGSIGEKEIPNVFGVDYESATSVLENDGFKVTAIEADPQNILPNTVFDREIKKGIVFKINDEVNPNPYQFVTKNQNITIYYSNNDYMPIIEEESVANDESETENIETDIQETEAIGQNNAAEDEKPADSSSSSIRPEIKAVIDGYESFMDEYIAFMEKYNSSSDTTSMLSDFSSYMSKYAEMTSDFQNVENENLTSEELKYYAEVEARVAKKLIDASIEVS